MAELAAGAQQRQIDDIDARLRDLTGVVAEHGAKILGAPVPGRTWLWADFDEAQRAAALDELKGWMRKILIRYPSVLGRLRPCWPEHAYAVDALTAAYLTWRLAMGPKASAELFAHWLDRWLISLDRQLQQALSECGTGRHVEDDADVSRIG